MRKPLPYHFQKTARTQATRLPGVLLLLLLFWSGWHTTARAQDCDDQTPHFVVDLSSNPDSIWQSDDFFNTFGACCGLPITFNCFTFEVYLHEDANAVLINLAQQGVPGMLSYSVNCVHYGNVPASMAVPICLDGPGPHHITFCRQGTASYFATISSHAYELDVSLDPIAPVCADSEMFWFSGGNPGGGSYYVDGTLAFYFNPASHGPGDYEITYVYQDPGMECVGSATQTLTVYPVPELQFPELTYCYGETQIPLSGATPEGGHYFGNYVVNGVFNAGFSGPGTFEVFYGYTSADGCYNEVASTITINPLPPADAGEADVVPQGETAFLNAEDADIIQYAYQWSPAALVTNPNNPNTTTQPLSQSTIFTLTVTDLASGCQNTATKVVYVSGGPLELLTVSAVPGQICEGDSVQLFVLPTGGSGDYSYLWTSAPPGFTSPHPDPVAYPWASTTFNVSVTDKAAPEPAQGSVFVQVDFTPTPSLELYPPAVCANETEYILTGGYPDGGYYSIPEKNLYNITSINPSLIGSGLHQVTYTFQSEQGGCVGMATQYLTIHPKVKASFYPQQDFCSTYDVTFLNLSENASTFDWYIGNLDSFEGMPIDPFDYTFDIPYDYETHTVTMVATSEEGCYDTYTREVTITAPTIAAFSIAEETSGCSPHTVSFSNNTSGPVSFYLWEFGDGSFSIGQSPVHTFENHSSEDTTFTVILTAVAANFMCLSHDTLEITVHPNVQAGFGFDPPTSCHPYEIEIFNNAIGAHIYEWTFGDGNGSDAGDAYLYHTFENFTDEPITFTLTQTVSNLQGCSDQMIQEVLVYPYQESGFTADITEGCAPHTVTFTDQSQGAVSLWYYDFGDGGTASSPSPVHTFENDTDATITYTVMQVTDHGYFCPDTSYIDIVVHPRLKAGFNFSPAQACSPYEVTFTNTSSGHITAYHWDMGEGTIYTTDEPVFTHLFEHDEATPQTYTITLTVDNGECFDTQAIELVVYPRVEAYFEADPDTGCQPMTVNFTNLSTNATTFLWEFGDGGSSSAQAPQHTYQNLDFDEPQTYTVSLFTLSEHLCWDYYETEVTIFPALKADFSVDTVAGCSPFEVNIDHASLGAVSYSWDFGDGNSSDLGDAALSHTYHNTGDQPVTYQLTLLVQNAFDCVDTLTRNITVYPEVQAAYTATTDGCHPLQVTFSNQSENAHYFSWTFGSEGYSSDASPVYTFKNFSHTEIATFPVTLFAESVFGCADSIPGSITVFPKPDASFTVENSPGCAPHEVLFINQSEGASQYLWNFGDGNTGDAATDSLSHQYILPPGENATVFNVTLEVLNDHFCSDTLTHEVTIYPSIEAVFSANIIEGCHPLTVDFTNMSQGASAYASFEWFYGDGFSSSVADTVHAHTFNNYSHTETATYTVTLVAHNENACSDTTQLEITVLPAPLTSFTVPNPTGCGPHEVFFENLSEGASSFLWDFDDGQTSDTDELEFSHTYTQAPGDDAGLFTITLTASNQFNCTRTFEQTVTIYPEIEASFITSESNCHPLTVTFENTSQGAHSVLWMLGDENQSQEYHTQHTYFNHSYTETLDYVVTLFTANNFGCTDITSDTITVFPVPLANFDLSDRGGCALFEPEMYNLTIGGESYHWDFGNGTSQTADSAFFHTWDNTTAAPLTYNLWLTTENAYGCTDSSQQIINVYPRVTAGFTTSDGLFAGCSPYNVQFINESELSQYHLWNFGEGDNTAGGSPIHVFVNDSLVPVQFPVQLIATSVYNCSDTIMKDITVYPSPTANFMATPILQTYPSTTITLENLSSPGYWNYSWDFGDENEHFTTEPDPFTHTYQWDEEDLTTRTYTIELRVDNLHCESSKTRQVTITSPVPEAQFIPDAQGCPPLEVQFTNLSQHAHSFKWFFGDGTVALEENPQHIFFDPGEYEVMMIAYGDGGSDTTYRYVTVFEQPVADFFIVNPLIEIPYMPLEVVNQSQKADYFYWNFGDGNYSTEFQPTHYYQHPGHYTITLIASTATSPQCHDTLSLVNGLLVQEACRIVFPNAFTPDPHGPSGGHYNINNPDNTVFYPLYEGISEYTLEIYNRWGELIFRSNNPEIGWDGYYRGELSKMDVYVWRFSGRCENGKKLEMAGDVTLYR
jgi:PKD repeat protein